ncbi:MAG: hypothetical protein HON76_15770 [Candidatus Scalindua sp.]|jgi:hypothetical protein|nr:hypothetical protein [Candidatus Scalindua sp.]MBT5305448.1 hypothetical protein [Candidatus Scalindua sp.]MBT6051598.1 hypothetical protein [Candidatus Scalindua sp.]MBT6227242.1 hypothetical protein [Candidatus Scalindua sp.]MBT6563978.1 hypothetical protein [Candidatus Scalindua sp.]
METIYEGHWYHSHEDSTTLRRCGLYKDKKDHPSHTYDDDVTDASHLDDRVADKGNESVLSGNEITMSIQEFLEVGMKYKISIEVRDDSYNLRIENV